MVFFENFWLLWLESAPWLILGLVVAGLMKALIPVLWMQKQLGGRSRWATVKAAFIGAPLPLCSCGVVPAALSLRRSGASKSSTVSFLVATPETGPDSISLSYALLGPLMAIVRPIAAITSAIVAGLLVKETETTSQQTRATLNRDSGKSCCASSKTSSESVSVETSDSDSSSQTSCCGTAEKKQPTVLQSLASSLNYSFTRLLSDITFWLLIGLVVAAAIQTWIPLDWLASWGGGWTAYILMAVIGVPMYICASASTPIAAGLLAAGFSPGAILVFMLAGPATNIGTLGIIKQELGKNALSAYLVGVIVTAWVFGWAVDFAVMQWQWQDAISRVNADHEHESMISVFFAVLLIAAIARAKWTERVRNTKQTAGSQANHAAN